MREIYKYTFAAILTVATATAMASGEILEGVAASVNGETIMIGDAMGGLQEQLRKMSSEPGFTSRNRQEIFDEAFKRSLENLIARRLILQSYQTGAGRIPENMFDKKRVEIIEKEFGGDNSKLRAELQRDRISYEKWKQVIEENIIIQSMIQNIVNANVNVSPNEIRREYEARKNDLTESYQASFSVFGVRTNEQSNALLSDFSGRVAAGENFDTLGEEFSANAIAFYNVYEMCDPSKNVSPAIFEALRALENGAVSQPVPVGSQRFLVYLKESRPGRELTLREAVERVGNELRAREFNRLYEAWIGRLREFAAITYFK